jgi:UMF1 family MFS transporter
VDRKRVFGYCMYDFANSSYTTLISTVAYSVYFSQAVVGGTAGRGELVWSIATSGSHVVLILTSPILGAIADHSGRRKQFLLLTTVQTVTACAALALVAPGDVLLGAALYLVGTVGFEGGYVFYNAFLPDVATPDKMGRVSAWSWGTGFLGGLISLVACIPFLAEPLVDPASGALDASAVTGYRTSFVVVAAFFALFSIPTFLYLPADRRRPESLAAREYVRAGFRRVAETLAHLRRYREIAKFVVAATFFQGGIETVIKFAALYAAVTFGIQGMELLILFIVSNLVAVPGTLAAGHLADRIGAKRALTGTLVGWLVLVLVAATASSKPVFWVLAAGIAIGMGATQAIGRSFMAQISPRARESEFFGFYLLCNKIGSIASLLLFGGMAAATGDQRIAVLGVAPLFLVAIVVMLSVDGAAARQSAAS